MKCERLINLSKNWYLHVKAETMAPARMIQFIKNHVATCDTCLSDSELNDEIEKITELILPDSKIPKAVRLQREKEIEDEEDDDEIEDDDGEVEEADGDDSDDEEEEYMDDDEDLDEEDLDELE